MEILQYIEKYGFPWALSALFIFFIFHYYKQIAPRLENMERLIDENKSYDEELERIAENSNKALLEVARSNDNVANALSLINATNLGQMEIMKLLYEDTKETQGRLYTHDDRAEKIYTELREIKALINIKPEKGVDD